MLKLALRVLLLTIVLEAASLVFVEQLIVTLLVLVTIALSVAALVMRGNSQEDSRPSESQPFQGTERATASSGVETSL